MINQTDAERIETILFSRVTKELARLRLSGRRMVHYTNAEVAFSILQHQQISMRNAVAMNDYSEVQYGEDCLHAALNSQHGCKLKEILDSVSPGMYDKLLYDHHAMQPYVRASTYMTCASEHKEAENLNGRLSMWRAYGGDNGVALIINPDTIINGDIQLRAYSSPVAYFRKDEFIDQFGQVISNMGRARDQLEACGHDFLFNTILRAFRFATLSTKHPGFAEELEWRIIYMPEFQRSRLIAQTSEVIAGVPQTIHKLPLQNLGDVEKIIIGPSKFPLIIRDAFVDHLSTHGVHDADSRVVVSEIPLRR